MTTFDAIAQIRREALSRNQALRFLVEHFGFTVTYAREVIVAVFGENDDLTAKPLTVARRST